MQVEIAELRVVYYMYLKGVYNYTYENPRSAGKW